MPWVFAASAITLHFLRKLLLSIRLDTRLTLLQWDLYGRHVWMPIQLGVLLSPNGALRFNRSLIRQRAVAMGEEFRGKGIHVQASFRGTFCQCEANLT